MMRQHLRATGILAIVAAAWLAGCAHRFNSRPPGGWELRGAIVSVSEYRLAVRHKTGQVVDLLMDDRTIVIRDDRRQARDVLRRGRRVRVDVERLSTGDELARTVRVYGGS